MFLKRILVLFLRNFLTSAAFYKKNEQVFNHTVNCENRIIKFNDYPDGNLLGIYASIEVYQFNLIYLYADWDAKSIRYKDLMIQLACEFEDKVNFDNHKLKYLRFKKYF